MKSPTDPDAETVALEALAFLGGDHDRLATFLDLTGLDVAGLRAAARDPGFLAGVLDHIAGDERLLLSFAAESGRAPEFVAAAHARLTRRKQLDDP
jgi:Protein of unknown function (DUF3572)